MKWICWCICWFSFVGGWAQGDLIFIEQITMEGNQRTRDEIILRELKFQVGDTVPISHLDRLLEQ